MEHYWKQFQNIQKAVQLREKALEEALQNIEDHHLKQDISQYYVRYNCLFYGFRSIPFVIIGTLLATPLLRTKSRFYIREMALMCGISAGILYCDYLNSEHLWKTYGKDIMQYTLYNDNGLNSQQMQKMKNLYEKSKQYVPEKKEKMYD